MKVLVIEAESLKVLTQVCQVGSHILIRDSLSLGVKVYPTSSATANTFSIHFLPAIFNCFGLLMPPTAHCGDVWIRRALLLLPMLSARFVFFPNALSPCSCPQCLLYSWLLLAYSAFITHFTRK